MPKSFVEDVVTDSCRRPIVGTIQSSVSGSIVSIPAQQAQHAARERRLYAIICKITNVDSGHVRKFDKRSHKPLRVPAGKDKSGKPVELTDKSRCFRCGGLGHFALTNGQKCLTSIKISRDILDKITYPHIDNERPVPKNLTVNEVSESDEEQTEDEAIEAIEECDENDDEINEVDHDSTSEDDLMHEF